MKRIQFLWIFLALLLTSCPTPQPVNPPGPTPSAGGSVATGGTTSTGGTTEIGGSTAAAGDTSIYEEPVCNKMLKAAPKTKPNMSGWHPNTARIEFLPKTRFLTLGLTLHRVFWDPNSVICLDQGNLGSCTGNAVAQAISTKPFLGFLTQADAKKIYSGATFLDVKEGRGTLTYPPNDPGSYGSSALRSAINLFPKLITGYYSPTTILEIQNALQKGPCVFGTNWYTGMFSTTQCGELLPTGAVEGGHEIELIGWNDKSDIYWIRNSWGHDWGVCRKNYAECGYGYITRKTFQKLLDERGEVDCPTNNQ